MVFLPDHDASGIVELTVSDAAWVEELISELIVPVAVDD